MPANMSRVFSASESLTFYILKSVAGEAFFLNYFYVGFCLENDVQCGSLHFLKNDHTHEQVGAENETSIWKNECVFIVGIWRMFCVAGIVRANAGFKPDYCRLRAEVFGLHKCCSGAGLFWRVCAKLQNRRYAAEEPT
ncbi:hypothetical protein Hbal_2292 [Hirschia baltica ATCC 49814]|uniref:Uncharacterized protein n=1 Tax=Hirschia baltica (strain ATCC 49814 / DSM 5838 / IFAM 1418) TaxID=582402 RepID=C6XMQ8_HIRBI|nr:hypothetical protein Hbal_2292 [Hirschia baltica ATCC 49814]